MSDERFEEMKMVEEILRKITEILRGSSCRDELERVLSSSQTPLHELLAEIGDLFEAHIKSLKDISDEFEYVTFVASCELSVEDQAALEWEEKLRALLKA